MINSFGAQKPIKLPIFLLMCAFILPFLISWCLYHYSAYFHFKTLNHGVLIKPPIYFSNIATVDEKKWRIVYLPQEGCDDACKKTLFTLHQLRKALGKDSPRVQLILITDRLMPTIISDIHELMFTQAQFEQMQDALRQSEQKNFVVTNKIYLIDPIGNLFMYYSDTSNPMNILKDMEKVLEVSQIG